jgi:AcrR family transcriptional regulator
VALSAIGRRRAAARSGDNAAYQAKRAEFVRAGAQLFREQGFQTTTLADIAASVGADRATLYYYFASKDELLQDAVQDVMRANLERGELLLTAELSPVEKVRQFVVSVLASYEENYPQVFVYLQEDVRKVAGGRSEWARSMTRQARRLDEILRTILAEGVEVGAFRADVPVDLAANALWGMVNWTHRWFKPDGLHGAADAATAFATLFLDGVSVAPE